MQKRGLVVIGSGGGKKNGKKKIVGYTFRTSEPLSVDSGRKLLVISVTEYLKNLNSEDGIEECLVEYPFTEKHLNFSIMNDLNTQDGLLSANSWEGYVYYYSRDPDDRYQFDEVHHETFAEAKAIVDQQRTQND